MSAWPCRCAFGFSLPLWTVSLQREQPFDALIASVCNQPGAAATDRFPAASGCFLHQRPLVMAPAATP